MTRRLALSLATAVLGTTLSAQQPQIQNGRVETRPGTTIDHDIATAAGGATDPIWVAWREPMIDGQREMCSWYSDRDHPNGIRGDVLDGSVSGEFGDGHAPQITPPTGPIPLEAGTHVIVLARIVDRRVERLRTIGDDCPIDANGRVVYWLSDVPATESLRFLETQLHPDAATMTRGGVQSLVGVAISAIGLHRDAGADAILDRVATSDPDPDLRRRAASALATSRGAHGFETLRRLLTAERTTDVRRSLASDLGLTSQPGTADALLALAKSDADPAVRAAAIYAVPLRGGLRVVPDVVAIIDADKDSTVKTRGVSGLGRLPLDAGVPALLALARTDSSMTVRKQAVTELGRSKDPRAVAYLEELLKG